MWRGRSTACSRNIVGVAERAVGLAHRLLERASQVLARVDAAHPRPPPPATAFAKMGKPISSAWASSASTSRDGSVDFSTGTPAAIACSFAVTLLPAISSTRRAGR